MKKGTILTSAPLRDAFWRGVGVAYESYEFTWVGKKATIVETNKPIRKTSYGQIKCKC